MSGYDWAQILFLAFLIMCLSPLLGVYLANVFRGKRTYAHSVLGWLERISYKISGIDPYEEMNWKVYLKTLLLFNLFGFLSVFVLLIVQEWLPFNPQDFPNVSWPLAFNIAASFSTNTNWQSYAGESTLSYATQMWGLTVQNFLSAATGGAALLTLIRGFTRKEVETVGNFWVDLIRGIVYVLIPLSIILAIFLVSEGVIQTLSPYIEVTTLEGGKQTIPLGPVASQIAIKQIGTNGGGFFNANSAHPFENPTGFSNFLEVLAVLLIPAAITYAYGIIVNSRKHGLLLFGMMAAFWIAGLALSSYSERLYNPVVDTPIVLEGKETRFGTTNTLLWAVSTTDTANGSTNATLSSLSPLAGGVAMFNMMLGELIFGGIGVGMCSMIMFILLTVFLAGLMVGRTPEYLGNKIDKNEMQWVMAAILIPDILILIGTGISCAIPEGLSSLGNAGPHGFSEILYAFTSAARNNGSAFAGLDSNTTYYNLSLGLVIIIARGAIIIPSIAIAGLLAKKKIIPSSVGTFSTNTPLFIGLLACVIIIVEILSFFPALSLGPIVEHFLMLEGRTF